MSNLEPRIEAVRVKYGLQVSDFWQIQQNGQWVCKHAALEVVAVKAGVEWLPPQIIEANAPALVTSMIVTGKMDGRLEWATGETNPTNYSVKGKQPAYPWAMSEKRAKDRVVLKLVGIHGLVYSEDEMPSVAQEETKPVIQVDKGPSKNEEARKVYKYLQEDLAKLKTAQECRAWWKDADVVEQRLKLPTDWAADLQKEWASTGKTLAAHETVKGISDAVDDIVEKTGGKIVNDRFVENFVNGEPLDGEQA